MKNIRNAERILLLEQFVEQWAATYFHCIRLLKLGADLELSISTLQRCLDLMKAIETEPYLVTAEIKELKGGK